MPPLWSLLQCSSVSWAWLLISIVLIDSHCALALTVTTTCEATALAQAIVGPGITVGTASVIGGSTGGNICKQFGTFISGDTVTAAALDAGTLAGTAFLKQGVTISTGTASWVYLCVILLSCVCELLNENKRNVTSRRRSKRKI